MGELSEVKCTNCKKHVGWWINDGSDVPAVICDGCAAEGYAVMD